jgi:2,3,4,5-tetrahydropyridine-2-carboxylate N-succinyltransferase
VVLMPSFVNVGAYVDSGTMIDTWATVGSCAQIGKNCHISGGAGIGGVLEPLQASPVIIGDGCFIGARSEVLKVSWLNAGPCFQWAFISGHPPRSWTVRQARYSWVVFPNIPSWSPERCRVPVLPRQDSPDPALYCAVIVKRVDERTRSKTSINELLRD